MGHPVQFLLGRISMIRTNTVSEAGCCCSNYCLEGWLRLTVAIEKQRVTGAAFHWPVVPPGISVRHAPERYTGDNIAVLQIDRE
jgi:hypothetical protein